jgi:hypothetical protein
MLFAHRTAAQNIPDGDGRSELLTSRETIAARYFVLFDVKPAANALMLAP